MARIRRPKVLSLFSGIGGLDLGFEKAGFDIVATVEWDKDCCDTLRLNKDHFFGKETKIIQADITKIQPEEICSEQVDFFIGGPPCQTFSAIGRRAGGASGRLDARGDLFKQYCRLLKHYQPEGFMFENVRGILSSNKGQDWQDILKEFSSLGYKLKYRVLDTSGYGAPQHRERVILVGYKGNSPFSFPRPTHGPDSAEKREFVRPKDVLNKVDHTEDINLLKNVGGKYDHLLDAIPPGSNYLFYTEEMGHPEPKFAWRSKFSDFLYKADPSLPVKTIVASMGRYSGPFHWDSRKMSIGELLKLQGFPDGYHLSGGRTSKIKQIGNSVVPTFAYPLALAVKKTLFKDKSINLDLLGDDEILSIDKRKGIKAQKTRYSRGGVIVQNYQQPLLPYFQKEKKAVITIDSIKYYFGYQTTNQLKLLKTPSSDTEFSISVAFEESQALIHLCKNGSPSSDKSLVGIELDIHTQSLGGIQRITFSSSWYQSDRPYVFWDAINAVIATISHYPSIHELYGHFTEPNPKFSITRFKMPAKRDAMSALMRWMSVMEHTQKTEQLSMLSSMGFDVSDEEGLLRELRSRRIDIRTNLTNKRIGAGEFRICYPYTLPIDRRTFVTIS